MFFVYQKKKYSFDKSDLLNEYIPFKEELINGKNEWKKFEKKA
jgi:hypothetical protein